MREAILRLSDERAVSIQTDFSNKEIEQSADMIQEKLMDTDEGWNEDKIIAELEKKGYIKVMGPAPEIIDLMLI